jgi:hypothetical protein
MGKIKEKPYRTENLIFEGEKNKKHASISGRPIGTPHIPVSFCGKELRPHTKKIVITSISQGRHTQC